MRKNSPDETQGAIIGGAVCLILLALSLFSTTLFIFAALAGIGIGGVALAKVKGE